MSDGGVEEVFTIGTKKNIGYTTGDNFSGTLWCQGFFCAEDDRSIPSTGNFFRLFPVGSSS